MNPQYRIPMLMATAAFFTLAGYECIRSTATVLFKTAYGAENLPFVMAAMPLVVLAGVAIYGRILSKLGPRRTILVTSLGSGFLILLCYFMVLTGSKEITPVLYLLKELYIVLLIEQYWSYINSSIDTTTAKKVNGPITGIAGLGGVVGGLIVSNTATQWGAESMLVIAAISVIPAALVSNLAYRVGGEPSAEHELVDEIKASPSKAESESYMGWHWIRRNRVLAYLLAIVFIAQIISAVLDFKFQSLLSVEFAASPDEETAFQGQFWSYLNSSVLILQFVVAPILLSYLSLRWIHVIMPLVHFAAITYAIVDTSVFSVGLALFLFKAFDYSIFRAAKEVIYVPLSFNERYRAKELIDVFGYRSGKGVSSVAIVVLQRLGIAMSNYYLVIGLVATVFWLALIFPLTARLKQDTL